MLQPINICYSFRPVTRSLATGQIADLFGLARQELPHKIAENLVLDIRPGDRVLLTGPSGSGKSSLLRAIGTQLGAVDAMALPFPERPLIDALPGTFDARLSDLAACGLSEARLLLRTPTELSEGQRYRFRMALALANATGGFLLADEFGANLDRVLAKVLAFNLRKIGQRRGVGMLLATTHDDLVGDLQPDLWIRCREGSVTLQRRGDTSAPEEDRPSPHGRDMVPLFPDGEATAPRPQAISFAQELTISEGNRRDWPYFARWHYRSHHLAYVRRMVLLWHGEEPIGIGVFATPAASLALRTRYFGLQNPRTRLALQALNQQMWLLSRVVLHPTYRGAGIGAAFVRKACEACPIPWIETLSAMGHANPFFERAGFTRVGTIHKTAKMAAQTAAGMYGKKGRQLSAESQEKSQYSEPVYYVRDNRGNRCEGISMTWAKGDENSPPPPASLGACQ